MKISTGKSTVTLFTPDHAQSTVHPDVQLLGDRLPLDKSPKILGVRLDTYFSFSHHIKDTNSKARRYNSILKAFAGTTCGQDKEAC